jgi:signal transduction histidine kinase
MAERNFASVVSALRRIFLLRGESEVASTGLMLASILLFVVAGSAWLSVRTQAETMTEAQRSHVEATGIVLFQSFEALLASDDTSMVRRLLIDAQHMQVVSAGRIVLADGTVLAHTDAAQISTSAPPVTWPEGLVTASALSANPEQMLLQYDMSVPGKGAARLELLANTRPPELLLTRSMAGVGSVGAVALLAFLIVYRRMRARTRSIGVVNEALLAHHRGERAAEMLKVRETYGPEAAAWNALLDRIDEMEHLVLSRRVGEALAARREGSRDLGSACDVMREGLILIDDALNVTYANGAATVYLHADKGSMVGSPLAQTVSDHALIDVAGRVAAGVVKTWTAVEVEHDGDEASGVLRFNVRPLRREDTSAAMIVINDVTQQRIADEARNAFVAQVTHELRAPLTNIRIYAETAIEQGGADLSQLEHSLNVINQEAQRLEQVVGGMLSISEIEAGKYQLSHDDVRLDMVVASLQEKYVTAAAAKQITLDFDLPPKLPVIRGDREKITLALDNLIGNAIKYTPAGGDVGVLINVEDERVLFEVSDSGIGVSAEEQEKIFDRFYRADDTRIAEVTGSGLGLALARDVIRLHGGDITIESEIDEGSTLSMALPLAVKVS